MASLLQRITRRGSDAAPARIERRSLDNWTASTGLSLMKGSNIIGGLRNSLSGLGGATDKSINSYFTPTLIRNRYMMELFYNESWVASKFVDAPIDDMFVKWRRHTGEDEQAIQAMDDLEETLDMRTALAQSMKMGRIFGSGLLIMVTTEAPMEEPLDPRRIREGDLKNLLYLDRFNASIESWTQDLTNPNFARPEVYRIRSHMLEEELYVHHSRILRFDGKRSLNMEGWSGYYDRYWGVSEMAAAIIEVFHDAGTAASTAHLMQEASIPTVKIKRYRESLLNHPTPESPDMTALALAMSQSKGIFRTLFMDAEDTFERVAVTFAGVAQVLEWEQKRVAAMAGIPITRFLSASPAGMNATGESDAINYAIHVLAMQERFSKKLRMLDEVMARSLGMREALDYEWLPLMNLSEKEQADIAKTKAEALALMMDRYAIFENETRIILSGDPVFGELEELPETTFEEAKEPSEAEMELERERIAAKGGGNGSA